MPTLREAAQFFNEQVRKGKGHLHTTHPVIVEEEQAKREQGGTPKDGKLPTRIAWDAADNSVYRRWHVMRKRWMNICEHNPTLCTEAQLVLLENLPDETIGNILASLGEVQARQGPPKAEFPDFEVVE